MESIRALGLVDPLVRDGDVLLDGRNRLRACEQLAIMPRWVEWATLGCKVGQAEWIAAKNLDRRHLTPDQKASIGVEIDSWIFKRMAGEQKAKTQFEKGKSANPGGKPKAEVLPKPAAPEPSDANYTRNRIAKKAGVSRYKVEQAQKLDKAVANGHIAPSVKADVKAGKVGLNDALKNLPKPEPKADDLRGKVEKQFRKFIGNFAACEHPQVREIVKELIT